MFSIGKRANAHMHELLSAYMDNQLNAEERARVETHLRGCAPCAGDLRSRLYPVQASVSKNEERFDLSRFQRDAAAYAQAGLMPQSLVRVQEMGELRGIMDPKNGGEA